MQTIHYIANQPIIEEKIKAYFDSLEDFELKQYDKPTLPKVDYLLIVNPFLIVSDFYAIEEIWKKYLTKNSPNTKLIIADFSVENGCSNHIQLTHFPIDFKAFMQTLKPLNEQITIETINTRLIHKMKDFYRGHGGESLFQQLNNLMMTVKNISYTLDGTIKHKTYKQAVEYIIPMSQTQWQDFVHRWYYYKRFFDYAPFKEEQRQISTALDAIAPYFTKNKHPPQEQFIALGIPKQMKMIQDELKKIKDDYVGE
jgi:hypothetical protein